MNPQDSPFFRPIKFGALELRNRVVMAPMTPARAGLERIPTASMATHYTQRAGAVRDRAGKINIARRRAARSWLVSTASRSTAPTAT